jgi:hypothetical protein
MKVAPDAAAGDATPATTESPPPVAVETGDVPEVHMEVLEEKEGALVVEPTHAPLLRQSTARGPFYLTYYRTMWIFFAFEWEGVKSRIFSHFIGCVFLFSLIRSLIGTYLVPRESDYFLYCSIWSLFCILGLLNWLVFAWSGTKIRRLLRMWIEIENDTLGSAEDDAIATKDPLGEEGSQHLERLLRRITKVFFVIVILYVGCV